MNFYSQLSRHYDEIFAVSEKEMSFIKNRLAGRACLLDLGCGTGNKTEFLAEENRTVIGLDLDPEMIHLARKNHTRPGLEYQVADLNDIGRLFPPKSFDGIVCLGNTLVHIMDQDALKAFFLNAAGLLKPAGLFILQILNYDYLLSHKIRELPLIETAQLRFRRFYDPLAECPGNQSGQTEPATSRDRAGVNFRSVLEIKGDSKPESAIYENSQPLRPLFKAELGEFLSADFEDQEYFGSYAGTPWTSDSFVTISTSRRR